MVDNVDNVLFMGSTDGSLVTGTSAVVNFLVASVVV